MIQKQLGKKSYQMVDLGDFTEDFVNEDLGNYFYSQWRWIIIPCHTGRCMWLKPKDGLSLSYLIVVVVVYKILFRAHPLLRRDFALC